MRGHGTGDPEAGRRICIEEEYERRKDKISGKL